MAEQTTPGMAELVRGYVEHSPFARHLGMRVAEVEPDRVALALPFGESLVTVADVVHGGAIAALIDTAATLAAWSGAELQADMRGTTVACTVNYVAAARAEEIVATARVVRRGRTICFCDVDVMAGERLVAKGLVTYKLG